MAAEETYIPKLTNMSIAAAVDGFKQSVYNESDTKILPVYNNTLFDELYIPHVALTPEVVEGILSKKLTANEIVLGRNNLDEHHRRMAFSQTALEKFAVLDWNVEEKYVRGLSEYGTQIIDIIAFLKDFLCPESRLTLKELCIRGHGTLFTPDWVSELLDLLPGITVLDVSSCIFTDENFSELCERYPDLTQLYMEGTGVRNLDGIEKLNKLKTLSVENLHLEDEMTFVGLSSLENLEVLNVSFYTSSDDSSQQSLREQISIPSLKILNITSCQINEECAQRIFNLNPNLVEIFDLKYVLDPNFSCNIFERKRSHHVPNAKKFCSLLKHHERSPYGCFIVLFCLRERLSSNQIKSEENTKELLMCLMEVLRNPIQDYRAKLFAIRCLQCITQVPGFGNTLTLDEKEYIGKTLCNTIKTEEWNEKYYEECVGHNLFLQIIQLALNAKFLEPVKQDNAIADVCVHFLTKSFCFTDTPLMCEYLVLYNQTIGVLSKFKADSVFDIKIKILKNLQERELDVIHCKPLLEFFAIVAKVPHSQLGIVNLNHNYVDIIFEKMELFEFDETIVRCGFICLQLLYHQLKNQTKKKEQFECNSQIIKTCVLSDNESNKTAAIKFIIEAYKSNIEQELYKPLAQPEMETIVAEILGGDDVNEDKLFHLVEKFEEVELTSNDMLWLHQKLYKKL